jgi:hypothetical protein
MNSRFDETLARVAGEVFEGLAFMLSMPLGEGEDSRPPGLAAKIAFTGPCEGFVILRISAHLLPVLAANMLGLDEDDEIERSQQEDALGELLTVLCGTLLPEVAGPEAVFDLNTPEIIDETPEEATAEWGDPAGRAHVVVDDGYAEFTLFVRGDLPTDGMFEGLAEARQSE